MEQNSGKIVSAVDNQLTLVRGVVGEYLEQVSELAGIEFKKIRWSLGVSKKYGQLGCLFAIKPEYAEKLNLPLQLWGMSPWEIQRQLYHLIKWILV